MNGYTFWIETDTGEYLEWNSLTKTVAQRMYATTNKNTPANLRRWGWNDCTEGYTEPVDQNNLSDDGLRSRYELYVSCVGVTEAKTFDEWLNT